MTDSDEFQWDYSYFKWQDIPAEESAESRVLSTWSFSSVSI